MHIYNQSSASYLIPKTNFELDSAAFSSGKAKGTGLLYPLKHETEAKDITSRYLAPNNLQDANLVCRRNDAISAGFGRLIDVYIRPLNDRLSRVSSLFPNRNNWN